MVNAKWEMDSTLTTGSDKVVLVTPVDKLDWVSIAPDGTVRVTIVSPEFASNANRQEIQNNG